MVHGELGTFLLDKSVPMRMKTCTKLYLKNSRIYMSFARNVIVKSVGGTRLACGPKSSKGTQVSAVSHMRQAVGNLEEFVSVNKL